MEMSTLIYNNYYIDFILKYVLLTYRILLIMLKKKDTS